MHDADEEDDDNDGTLSNLEDAPSEVGEEEDQQLDPSKNSKTWEIDYIGISSKLKTFLCMMIVISVILMSFKYNNIYHVSYFLLLTLPSPIIR